MHGVVIEFSRELTNLMFMNFKLITKHTNTSFENIHSSPPRRDIEPESRDDTGATHERK